MKSSFCGAVFLAAFCVTQAFAGDSDNAVAKMLACDYADSSKARLKCFDAALAALRDTHPQAAKIAVTERRVIEELATAQTAEEFGLKARESANNAFVNNNQGGNNSAAAPSRSYETEAESLDRIEGVSAAVGRNNGGRIFVVLENGQIWRQLKSDSSRPIIGGDGEGLPVLIKRGALGSFFVKVGRAPGFKAERVK